jgi:hypothetical protein
MSQLQNVEHMLEQAKRAADAGELASADVLLHDVARIQETELGPLHPALANTVNNLAVVAEMEGRVLDAEAHYRRAVAIATASLPPDDPIVVSSRKNLEDFCREHGLPIEPAAAEPSMPRSGHPSDEVTHDRATSEPKIPADIEVTDVASQTSTPASRLRSVADSTTDAAARSSVPVAAATRPLAIVAIGLVALVAVVLLIMRPWSGHESAAPDQPRETPAPQAAEPAPPRPAAPIEQPKPPTGASRDGKSGVATASPEVPGRSSDGMTLVTSQLCRTFSAGNNWRCDPVGQSVAPGPVVLYTRVKSPRDAIVIHRWYLGDTLRKSARLTILTNTTDGYRTYSRQTVKSGEDWRVEVRSTAGDLLYEQRLSVQ